MEKAAFTALFFGAWIFFLWSVWRIVQTVRRARPGGLDGTSGVRDVFTDWLGQRPLWRNIDKAYPDAPRSWHHPFIFWGFLAILPASVEVWGRGFVAGFTISLLDGWYRTFLDLVHAVVIGLMLYALSRRTFFRPKAMRASVDGYVILTLILLLSLTHFTGEAAQAAMGTGHPGPISSYLAGFIPAAGAHGLHRVSWWIHALILLAFLDFLPYSKHVHILTSIFAIYFRSHGPRGVLPRLSVLEDDRDPDMGPSSVNQLRRRDVLDLFACTECARCTSVCPAVSSGLSPMELIQDLKSMAQKDPDRSVWESQDGMPGIVPEHLWACTTCGACEEVCPVGIEHTMKIIPLRTNLVLEQESYPGDLARVYRNLDRFGNPWGMPAHERMAWARDLDVPLFDGSQEWLLWLGCASSLDDGARSSARAAVRLFLKLGISFGILGEDEPCCGDPARRTGNEFLFQMMAEGNVQLLEELEVTKMVFMCPHGLHLFRNEYPQFGFHLDEALHYTQLLDRYSDELRSMMGSTENLSSVVFHDPCYLGRRQGDYADYASPRNLLALGVEVKDVPASRELAMCCGGGGGRIFMEDTGSLQVTNSGSTKKVNDINRIEVMRVEQLAAVRADSVCVACPMCKIMLTDGARHLESRGGHQVLVMDIAEVMWQKIENTEQDTRHQ